MKATLLILTGILAALASEHRSQAAVAMTALPEPLLLYDPSGTNGTSGLTPFDLNGDGLPDYTFAHGFSGIAIRTERDNHAAIHIDPPPNLGGSVEALYAGYMVGSSLLPGDGWVSSDLLGGYVSPNESAFTNIVLCVDTGCESRMPAVLTRVQFGLEFQIAGQTHYGYFDVEAQHDTPGIRLHGWAYETAPNTPIIAGSVPEPDRIGFLILGMAAFLRRRRRALGSG